MIRPANTRQVHTGILLLPLSGLLAVAGTVGSYGEPQARVDITTAAQAAVTTGYFISQLASLMSLTALIFGIMALATYLSSTRARTVASIAMVLGIVGIALILSILGLRAYALPAVGTAYLNGQENAVAIFQNIFDSPKAELAYVVAVGTYSTAFLLFGVAIWRSGVLRKGAAVSLALHAPLLSSFIRPQTSLASIIGALLFTLGGALIYLGVSRRSLPGRSEVPRN